MGKLKSVLELIELEGLVSLCAEVKTLVKDPVQQVLEQPFGFNTAEADQDEAVAMETWVMEGDGGGGSKRKIPMCGYTELTRLIYGVLQA